MSSTLGQQVNEQGLYQPAHQPVLGKDNLAQKYEFDSPSTIAKQTQFQQAGGQQQQWGGQQVQQQWGGQQGIQSGSLQAPPLPQARTRQPRRQINLRTRDWNNQPWNHQGQGQVGGDSYRPPASLLGGSSWVNNPTWHPTISSTSSSPHTPSLLGVYDPKVLNGDSQSDFTYPLAQGGQQFQQPSSSLPPLHPSTASSGLPSANYQPSSTIPLSHNYQLPHSHLANSSIPQQQNAPTAQLNKNYLPGNTLGNNSLNTNNFNNNIGNNSFGGIPNAPVFGGYRRGGYRNSGSGRQMRPLRTRNWGTRSENGWGGFNNQNAIREEFLQNRLRFAPEAPRIAPIVRQRQWQRGPYRQRPLRTRHWGVRSENGWSHFNRGIYAHEAALPFNNRNRNLNWADQGLNQGLNQNTNSSYIPIQNQNQGLAPVAALAPLTGGRNLSKRASRRQAKKQAKQASIAQQLNTQLNPPIGDPAVNHYRRGAPAAVPIIGAAPGGQAAPNGGKFSSRRRGRRNNLGHRRGRTQQNALPVPATQPPFVAPVAAAPLVAAPLNTSNLAGTTYPSANYRTVHNNAPINNSGFVQQPAFGTQQGYSSNYPLSNSGSFSQAGHQPVSGALYSQGALQQRPLSNTLGGSSGISSNLPLYSSHEPVAASILEKRAQAPVASTRPIGSATF